MSWNLKGEMIESCSCNMLCPCWFGPKELMVMDQGWCASPLLFRIQAGNADGIALDGCTVVAGLDFPGPTLYDGNGTGRVYIDEVATAEQRQALEAIFQGKRGGPMAILANLLTTWLSSQYPKIEIQEEGDKVMATVGHFGRVKSELLRSEAGQPLTIQHAGFTVALQFQNETGQLAPSGSQWFDPELPRPYETRSGVRGAFHWQGD